MPRTKDVPLWLPPLLLILALIALFHRLLAGDTLFWGLPTLQFYPWRQFAFSELGAGRLPTWNPYLGAGAPLLANYQTALFYPPNWPLLVLPDALGMSLIAVGHIVWAWLGMWLFLGALRLDTFGRAVGALAYALGGYLIARVSSFPTADAGAWLPWLFWLTHRIVIGQRTRDVGGLALVFGLQLLAGHAQTAWYSVIGVGVYALWLGVWGMETQPTIKNGPHPLIPSLLQGQRGELAGLSTGVRPGFARLRGLMLVGAGLALGAALAAIQLVPTAEYLRHSDRSGGLDYATLTNLSYHPARLLALFSPNVFGTPADGSYFTNGIYFEDAAYIGFIPLIAAFAAIVAWARRRRRPDSERDPRLGSVPFWIGLGLVALILSMGKNLPLYRVLYDYVPTFNAFREPVRWLILTEFALAVLSGIGVAHWGRGPRVVFWSRLAAAGGGAMAVLALAARASGSLTQPEIQTLALSVAVLGAWIAGAALLTLVQPVEGVTGSPRRWRAVVLVFITLDLAWMASGLNPTVPTAFFDRADLSRLPGRIYWFHDYERAVTFGTEDADDPVQIEGFFDLSDYRIAQDRWQALRRSLLPDINMLDRIPALSTNDPLKVDYAARYIALIEDVGTQAGALLRAAGVNRVYGLTPDGWNGANPAVAPYAEAPDVSALAWTVPEAAWFDSDAAIESALRDPAWDPLRTVIVAGSPPDESGNIPLTDGAVIRVAQTATERRYHVTGDGAGYLVMAAADYPGWTVQVNGQDAPLLRANLAFQAVRFPPGESDVVVRYRLAHFAAGASVSALALLIALGLIAAPWLRRRSSRR